MNLESQLRGFEDCVLTAYPDPLTKGEPWTIGVGHTGPDVWPGLCWTPAHVDAAIHGDIAASLQDCIKHFPWFCGLNDARRAAVAGMRFQMGMPRLLGFKRALEAMRDQQWHVASGEMLNSAWARQTPRRAAILARQVETGEWQT